MAYLQRTGEKESRYRFFLNKPNSNHPEIRLQYNWYGSSTLAASIPKPGIRGYLTKPVKKYDKDLIGLIKPHVF